ncbi:MAG: glycosyl transferase [Phocaeicola sp.]
MITLIPSGGLANRMKAIASGVALASELKQELIIYWFQTWGLQAPFAALFQPIRMPLVRFHEASNLDYLLRDRPRKKNFYLPALYQRISYDRCLYEQESSKLLDEGFDFKNWAAQKKVFLTTYVAFHPYSSSTMQQLFVPLKEIQTQIEQVNPIAREKVIGVHIRRTDHILAIENSPIELFFERIDQEIASEEKLYIYLATDSEEVKQEMKERYGKRILTSPNQADRESIEGIKEGVVDLFALGNTKKIYGSFNSTFSAIAAQLGDTVLEIVQK